MQRVRMKSPYESMGRIKRRYLTLSIPSDVPFVPHLTLVLKWNSPRLPQQKFVVHWVTSYFGRVDRVTTYSGTVKDGKWVHSWGGLTVIQPADWGPFPYDLTDLYELARQCAARRAPVYAIFGWIEDNLPEPWSLLASPNPTDCIRALCPIPLAIP